MAASNPHNEPGPSDPTLDSVLSSASGSGAPKEASPSGRTPEQQQSVLQGLGLPTDGSPLPQDAEIAPILPQGEPGSADVKPGATIQMPTFSASNRTNPLADKLARNPKAQQVGAEPPDMAALGEGGEQGTKSPGFDAIRGADDVAGAMVTYQNQLMSVLTTMQRLLIEGNARLEALEAYFDRLR